MERHEMDVKFNMSREELSQQTLLFSSVVLLQQ